MIKEQDLNKIIQQLRRYQKAVNATRGGLHQLTTQEAQEQLEQRLQTAYALKAELDEELDAVLENARLWLEAQASRLEIARKRAQGKG